MKKFKKIITMSLMVLMLSISLGSNFKVFAARTAYVPIWEDVRETGAPYYLRQVMDSYKEWITYISTYQQNIVSVTDITPWTYLDNEKLYHYEYEYDIN